MDSLWPPVFLLCSIFAFANTEPYYAIVAPNVVRPNSEYHVTVTTTGTSSPAVMSIELNGRLDNGEFFNASQRVAVQPYSTRILKLEVGDTSPGQYELVAKGLSGLTFTNSTPVNYVHKSYSVFIQTDRAVYKPGNNVMFRCIILDSRLRPAVTRQMDVYITDGHGNRIKQWNRPPITRGVFSSEISLSESPVLGDWKIIVNVADQTFEKVFEVAEYVLPKFEVTIDSPADATFKDEKIVATIHAKYTYGKPVKGEVTVTAHTDILSSVLQPIFQAPVRKVLPIDGKVTVEFDIAKELRVTDDWKRPVQLEVAVEESSTGRRQNASMQLTLHKHRYAMELVKTAQHYKPGLKYTAFIRLAYHDGTPVRDTTNPVNIAYGFTYSPSEYINTTRFLDEHGMVQLDFYPPTASDGPYYLNIEARYLNLHEAFGATPPALSPSNNFIQAVLKTHNPMVNHEVEIEVNCTEPLKYLSYKVLGRGDILDANSIQIDGKNTASFRFLATYVMAPTAHVLVFYVRDDGEVVADALDINLDGMLQNFVDIKLTPEETSPGGYVDLTISSKPNSYIGLLGVDQRSLLLKSGNDLTREKIKEEVKSYDMVHDTPYPEALSEYHFWSPGSETAEGVFKETGTVILTNGYVHENFPLIYFRASLDDEMVLESADVEASAATFLSSEKIKVRKNFPETWLWQMLDAGVEGKTVIRRDVPDSITSWVLTAFSLDSVHGLGLIEAPRKLKVFKSFFLSIDLPYSVIRGEIVAITIVVFNYMNKDVTAEVLLDNNSGQFEFAEMSNEVHDIPKLELYRKKRIDVKANSSGSVAFMITPRDLGYVTIKATANSVLAGDSVERKLLVKAEGETQYRNRATFIDLRNTRNIKTNITVDIPKNIVSGSEHIEISAVGDLLGPSIPNLASLIKLPSGCGEQNMLNFVPNIVVLNYLKNTNQLTQAIQSKALKYLEVGYQQELTYRHSDGSFSAFGMSDPTGSTWLTAFVVKSFLQASDYVNIERHIIDEALQWLSNNQAANGSFPEVGKVSHRDMQGGASKGLALTAFTLLAFLENQNYTNKYRNTVNKGVDYILRNMEGLEDVYALSICTYVLNLAKHPYEDTAFNLLESKVNREGDYKWWSKPVPKDDQNPWYSLARCVDVEMTSYALLTYLQRNLVADSVDVMKWLVKQRNAEGGFSSTQDTVVGIYALSKLAEKLASSSNNIAITYTYDGGERSVNINSANVMILQKHVIPRKVRNINITASGNGFAIIQVSSQYNLNVTGAWPLFTLDPQVDKNSNANHLQLSICSGFVPTKESNESNMAVMEVSLPSGFTVDMDTLPSLEVSQHVKRVETRNDGGMVVLYFDKMVRQEYCPTVSAYRTHKVAEQKPVPVSIYDYYDSTRRARSFYEPRKTTVCDVCEDEDCGDICVGKKGQQNKPNDDSSASQTTLCTYLLTSLLLFVASHKYFEV